MVGNTLFNINMRLPEIFTNEKPFGGISVLAIGDLYQLMPVFDCWIFEDLVEGYGPLAQNLWCDLFKTFELAETMRQKVDSDFEQLLNRMREGVHTDDDIELLKSSQNCTINEQNLLETMHHLFKTNAEVNSHNTTSYRNASNDSRYCITAIDFVTGNVKQNILTQVSDDANKTMELIKDLYLAVDLSAEVCLNIDVVDGLTNG